MDDFYEPYTLTEPHSSLSACTPTQDVAFILAPIIFYTLEPLESPFYSLL